MKKFSELLKEALSSENVEHELNEILKIMDDLYMELKSNKKDLSMVSSENWHFNEKTLKDATKSMQNEDGTIGAKWNVEQTSSIMKENGLKSDMYNEFDFNYVMNMLYSDFYQLLGNDAMNYYKMAKYFLEDKDAPKGKAYRYYIAMHPNVLEKDEHNESSHKKHKRYDDYDDYEDYDEDDYIIERKPKRQKPRRRYEDYEDDYDDYYERKRPMRMRDRY